MKTWYTYSLFRILFLALIFLAYYSAYFVFPKEIKNSYLKKTLTTLFPFILLLIIFFVTNLTLFNFQYSLLGKYKKSSPPPEEEIFKYGESSCSLSNKTRGVFPSCIWKIYPSGLGLSVFIYGETFIPLQDMIELKSADENFSSKYTLSLNNPELRLHKIILPEKIFRGLKNLLQTKKKQM